MTPPRRYRPGRTLLALALLLIGMFTWAFWPGTDHAPRLGLDLRGGTQVILVPRPIGDAGPVTDVALKQSVEIIRQRVNAFGVAEAEVTTQGSGDNAAIVVSVPGVNQQQIAEQIKQTALLDFRAVSAILAPTATPTDPAATPTPAPTDPAAVASPAPTDPAATPTPTPAPSDAAVTPAATPVPSDAAATPAPTSTSAPLLAPVEGDSASDPAILAAVTDLDCTLPENRQGGRPDDPVKWIVTCDIDGSAKYLLEPAFLRGTNVTDATANLPQQGGGGWQVDLTFDDEGATALAETSTRLVSLPPPQNQFGIVLDGLVQSAPVFQQAILGGQAQITGTFTIDEAQELANILKYGALPVTLEVAEITTVSPTLGSDQLKAGLLAGALGLFLVGVYLILYYRALGIVAVLSLVLAAAMTYAIFVIMGRTIGLALTLAGVAGAIVAIGITADSFVVYFERIRDEIRDGRSLRSAAESGWARARNTLLAADFVSLLAAVVLYAVSVGNVRGFAFVLGLTTVIDVIVAFMFTRPMVALLARTAWFNSGSALTGVNPTRLGVTPDLVLETDDTVGTSGRTSADTDRAQPAAAGKGADNV